MNSRARTHILPFDQADQASPVPTGIGRMPLAARLVLGQLARLEGGCLQIDLPDGSSPRFGNGNVTAVLVVNDWSAFGRIVRDGDIGFAEAWLDGQWDTPDLTGLLTLLARNRRALDGALYGSWAGRLAHRIVHALRANTRAGSRRNIAAHYDLGNNFYGLWLDPGMTYSSALFGSGAEDLATAQAAKYARVLEELQLAPHSEVLEIGCGWGGFAELCLGAGHRLTGVSLSRRQLAYAHERLAKAGLAAGATLEYRDYRDLQGRYDAIASIEMLEAVGERWWPAYFSKLASLLRPGGRAVVQSILIDPALFERYRSGSDFIQQYIFPGGMLPTGARVHALARSAGLEVCADFRFGGSYARTLALWHHRVLEQAEAIRRLGFDARFLRLWRFYLAYCEAGFLSGSTDVAQFTLQRS